MYAVGVFQSATVGFACEEGCTLVLRQRPRVMHMMNRFRHSIWCMEKISRNLKITKK